MDHPKTEIRVLVAGATGAIGLPIVRLLLRQGYDVMGTTRTPGKRELLHAEGAASSLMDGLDRVQVEQVVAAYRPDIIIHQMTSLVGADLRQFAKSFEISNQLRTIGTDNLLFAARQVGVRKVIAQSFCGWPYERSGAPAKPEEAPFDPDPPRELRTTLSALIQLERKVTQSKHVDGIILRYGAFYGPNTGVFEADILHQLRMRRFPMVGKATGCWSFVHVEDAAAATLRAIKKGRAGSIYNVVDDEPAVVQEWLPYLAEVVGAPKPFRVPAWFATLMAGEHLVVQMTEVRGGSNAKAKKELDWNLRFPAWREGFKHVAADSYRPSLQLGRNLL